MNKQVLDFVNNVEVDVENLPGNFQALSYLAEGMRIIASNVLSRELTHREQNTNQIFSLSSSNNPELSNFFNWFAINAVSYCRLVTLFKLMDEHGWKTDDLKANVKKVKNESNSYVTTVIPEVYLWRNKIAAHPAMTDPWNDDNVATLEFSVMPNIAYINNRFYAGAFSWSTEGHVSNLKEWSVTQVFEEILIPRFWPKMKTVRNKQK